MSTLPKTLRVLHTSDWHIGGRLNNRDRYEEHEAFLSWLQQTIKQQNIDVLLVAGDVFDTSAPSNRAQKMYYNFLCCVVDTSCRHVVVVAGNHDSPTFLNAPQQILKVLNVHVIGQCTDNLEDEILVLADANQTPELIVCAAPYLRDRDIRTVEPGETADIKAQKLVLGIQKHYKDLAELAQLKRQETGLDIPIIATGHLFAAGGQTLDGDGVRDLYVGALGHVGADVFPATFNYVALGHLHTPQKVNGCETIRYCGAPLPMGFVEAKHPKNVLLVSFDGPEPVVTPATVPVFRHMESIAGDWDAISKRLNQLLNAESSVKTEDVTVSPLNAWLEVIYDGQSLMPDFSEKVQALVQDSTIDIVRHRIKQNDVVGLTQEHEADTLDLLTPQDVFTRLLTMRQIPEEQHPELLHSFQELVQSIQEHDARAE